MAKMVLRRRLCHRPVAAISSWSARAAGGTGKPVRCLV